MTLAYNKEAKLFVDFLKLSTSLLFSASGSRPQRLTFSVAPFAAENMKNL